jgi:hypothetical protein
MHFPFVKLRANDETDCSVLIYFRLKGDIVITVLGPIISALYV